MMMNNSTLNDRVVERSPVSPTMNIPEQIEEENPDTAGNNTQEDIPAGYETANASVNKSAAVIDESEADYSMADTSVMDYTIVNGKKMKKKKKKKKKKGNGSANTSQVIRSGSQVSNGSKNKGDQSMHPIEEDKGEEEEYVTSATPAKISSSGQQRLSIKPSEYQIPLDDQ
jgi:hypothetical protein